MTASIDEARAALRTRQGAGARYDAPNAPARDLDWARRGTAYFARIFNGLADADLDAPSALPGLTRRRLIVEIGYQARRLGEMVAWIRTGRDGNPPYTIDMSEAEIARGLTLPDHALRHLFEHSKVHLDVEWRDLDDRGWQAVLTDAAGRQLAMRDTPRIRASALWSAAIDLDAGGRAADIPRGLVDMTRRRRATNSGAG